jgi:V-type H+-transporting ATPase subunit A
VKGGEKERINLMNAQFREDSNPIEEECPCETCTTYSRAYIHHLLKAKEILALQDNLQEIVQLVGKESLSEDQKVVLEIADIIIDDFLAQNAFSDFDYMCPLHKSVGMLKSIVTLYESAMNAISKSSTEKKFTWASIKLALAPTIQKVKEGKFHSPKANQEETKHHYDTICKEIVTNIAAFIDA